MTTISFSEIEALNRCERLWWYSYVRKLVPNREDERMGRGTVMHNMLAEWARRGDADYQDFETRERAPSWVYVWQDLRAHAIESALVSEETEQIENEYHLYRAIMERFVRWHEGLYPNGIKPVAIEEPRLAELATGFSLKFKPDLLFESEDRLWLRDYKTVVNFDENMALRADFDAQLSFYVWGLRGLGYPVEGVEHIYLRMRLPGVPDINKDGSMSLKYIITEEETVRQFLAESGATFKPSKGIPSLEAYLARLPREAFFRRFDTIRTDEELEAISEEIRSKAIKRESLLAGDDGGVTRTMIRDCTRCPYLGPCLAGLKGGDEEALLAEGFRERATEDEQAHLPIDLEEGGNDDNAIDG